jgi:hypothetical protein
MFVPRDFKMPAQVRKSNGEASVAAKDRTVSPGAAAPTVSGRERKRYVPAMRAHAAIMVGMCTPPDDVNAGTVAIASSLPHSEIRCADVESSMTLLLAT